MKKGRREDRWYGDNEIKERRIREEEK